MTKLLGDAPFAEFITLDGETFVGWVYMQRNPVTGLVDADSVCAVYTTAMMTPEEKRIFRETMAAQGFELPMEAKDFFGIIRLLQEHGQPIEVATMLRAINYYIENDSWPLDLLP